MMVNFEKEILEHVRQHPACDRGSFDTISPREPPDVQCMNCITDLRPENALMVDGNPFCDEFCAEHYAQGDIPLPLTSELHRDGTIHIYVKEKDSGLSVGLLDDGTLIIEVGESKRAVKVGGRD